MHGAAHALHRAAPRPAPPRPAINVDVGAPIIAPSARRKNGRKRRENGRNLTFVSGMASVASNMGWLWTGWIGPALVQMSGMLSVHRAVVIVFDLLQGLVVFVIDLSFLREQSPWSFLGLDSCVLAYCSSAAPLLSLQSFYNYARGHCEAAQASNCSGVCWEEGMEGY